MRMPQCNGVSHIAAKLICRKAAIPWGFSLVEPLWLARRPRRWSLTTSIRRNMLIPLSKTEESRN